MAARAGRGARGGAPLAPAKFVGPVVGAVAFVAFQQVVSRVTPYHGLVTSVLLIGVVFACRGGVAGATVALAATFRRRAAARADPSSWECGSAIARALW